MPTWNRTLGSGKTLWWGASAVIHEPQAPKLSTRSHWSTINVGQPLMLTPYLSTPISYGGGGPLQKWSESPLTQEHPLY